MTVASSLDVDLFETGVAISQFQNRSNSIFLEFPQFPTLPESSTIKEQPDQKQQHRSTCGIDNLKVVSNFKSAVTKGLLPIKKTVSLQSLLGWTKIGFGGVLIFVSKSDKIVDDKNISLNIYKVADVVLIPLNYKQALNVFKKLERKVKQGSSNSTTGTEKEELLETDDEDYEEELNGSLEDIESILAKPDIISYSPPPPLSATATPTPTATGNFSVTNFGILADSVKARPKLSLNDENISTPKPTPIIEQQQQNQLYNDEIETHFDSFRHHKTFDEARSILSFRSGTVDPSSYSFPINTSDTSRSNGYTMSNSLLKKLKRNLRLYLRTSGFYFSSTTDLTSKFNFENGLVNPRVADTYKSLHEHDSTFLWNRHIMKPFVEQLLDYTHDNALLITPLICGFVGAFDLKLSDKTDTDNCELDSQLMLLSKRSTLRSGLRYMRRGVDDDGNVANFVVTDQFLIIKNKNDDDIKTTTTIFEKYRIFRGSIPLFFQQDSSKLQPAPTIQRNFEQNKEKFQLHFKKLSQDFPDITCISLIEKKRREQELGELFQKISKETGTKFVWFDFHSVCTKMRFDKVELLLDETIESSNNVTVGDNLIYQSYDGPNSTQTGYFRINCIDCLDRTNIVSKFICNKVLDKQLDDLNLTVINKSEFRVNYSNLWANNGDYISTQYASTNALKGDFTRTEQRKYSGILTDGLLTLSRYYYGYVTDFYRQVLIDFLLGNVKEDMFEQFESSLTNLDPNLTHEQEIKQKLILDNTIQVIKFDRNENLIGNWWIESNITLNEVRKRPMKSCIFILTNLNSYLCDFDEKKGITQIRRISNNDITKLNYGHYYIDITSKISKNPMKNIGLRFFFKNYSTTTIELDSKNFDQKDYDISLDELFKLHTKQAITHEFENENDDESFSLSIRFPNTCNYAKVKNTMKLISKFCYLAKLEKGDIVSFEDAKKDTPLWKVIDHELKRFIWA